jgi:hypothetical protein
MIISTTAITTPIIITDRWFDHAHRGDDRIKGEHRVEDHDLHHGEPEARATGALALVIVGRLQALMQFERGLEQQERATDQQDQVAPGKAEAVPFDQGLGERDQPGHGRQQAKAHHQGQAQAKQAGMVALARGQLVGEDRDEDEVVDTEHDLQHDQREETRPGGRVG